LRQKSVLSNSADQAICQLILQEKRHHEEMHYPTIQLSNQTENNHILYRSGLLKKFVMDALMLSINRESVKEQYGSVIASSSAAIAMLAYLLLFIWQGNWFVINSAPFIILTVVAYVLKDRLKEALTTLSYQRAFRWFSDFTTHIRSPDEKQIIGELKESFAFVGESTVPQEILKVRNLGFHSILETFKRPEQIIYFKRTVKIFSHDEEEHKRRRALSIVLRFSIREFLEKASDPYHTFTTLDPHTQELVHLRLPKVYHLNLILKSSYLDAQDQLKTEISKFRLILDKNGIKEIEEVSST
jgi:hypothetical protein